MGFAQIPIYARAQDIPHLLVLKAAGATDTILENAESGYAQHNDAVLLVIIPAAQDQENAFSTFCSALGRGSLPDMSSLSSWNTEVLIESIKQLVSPIYFFILLDLLHNAPGINWTTVIKNLDHEGFYIPGEATISLLISCYRLASQDPFPLSAVCGNVWKNTEGQLSFLKYVVSVPPEVFTFAHCEKQGIQVFIYTCSCRHMLMQSILPSFNLGMQIMHGYALIFWRFYASWLKEALQSMFDCCLNTLLSIALKCYYMGWPMLIRGVVMAIPMPGHPIARQEEEKVVDDCKRLSDLIKSPDAVLCANANKVTITGALGFDSFLVMRHGAGPLLIRNTSSKAETLVGSSLSTGVEEMSRGQKDSKPRLGCYLL
uniref:Uncharacterized protein n=1 Tax=Lactuca sativa TaxID=4236 RepID=A0A9R1XUW0_LACSA|nr:hypothetical protein LSAT_V11C100038780 [Lactuca sativa]